MVRQEFFPSVRVFRPDFSLATVRRPCVFVAPTLCINGAHRKPSKPNRLQPIARATVPDRPDRPTYVGHGAQRAPRPAPGSKPKSAKSAKTGFRGNPTFKRKPFKKPSRRHKKARSKKTVAQLPKGVVHIQSSFNNTIITVTNLRGRVIAWSSAGANGFKGARKSTPFAAKIAAKAAGRVSFDQGLKLVKVMVKGGGSGRETAMRGLIDAGLQLAVIRDITGVPHNGCRPPKKRRV